ncbi:MAG: LPS export ABC transporter periplasmic protein LptC [Legionellales bacterium]|nr:LPS export ABC transporter periplasmic protein LptC [Legionellales bacterium]
MIKTQPINIILLLLAFITGWLWWHRTHSLSLNFPPLQKPTLLMTDVKAVRMNMLGSPQYQLQSRQIQFFQQQDKTYFIQPIVTLFSPNNPPWILQAREGMASAKFNTIDLYHHVILDQAKTAEHGATHGTTEKITLYPHQDLAQTQEIVTITRDGNRIQGQGMRADLKKDWIEFLAQVVANYDTQEKM